MEMGPFKAWLKRSIGLSTESAKDVVSRLRRASNFVNVGAKLETDDLLHQLAKHPDFKDLSGSVRSQLRRAIKLYREFLAR